MSVAAYSWSRKKMSRLAGIGILRAARAFMMVDLPDPLGPRKPYRLPAGAGRGAEVRRCGGAEVRRREARSSRQEWGLLYRQPLRRHHDHDAAAARPRHDDAFNRS